VKKNYKLKTSVMNFKKIVIKSIIIIIILVSPSMGCKNMLDEEIYSELVADNFLNTPDGIEKLLLSSYSNTAAMDIFKENYRIMFDEMGTDILWQQRGLQNAAAIQIYQFTLDSGIKYLEGLFTGHYQAIRDANLVLDNLDSGAFKDTDIKRFSAEARFLRAVNYYFLWDYFGGVPLRTSSSDPKQMPRSDEATILKFIEDELLASVSNLPNSGEEESYGKATKGAANAFLCKLYLNTKQWQKCADQAKIVMDMNYYSLFPDYTKMMAVENEQNKEMIWVRPANSQREATGNRQIGVSTPAGFKSDPKSGIVWQSNWANFASDFLMYDAFYNSFEGNDKRTNVILTSYVNNKDKTIKLLGTNSSQIWKYVPDPNANGQDHGNDMPVIRYADILLSRAEAINEITGPTPETLSLINLVRKRAGIPDILISDFSTKESLRAQILTERGHEFFYEGLRRRDLLRQDKYIEFAIDRGVTNATGFRKLYPIPLSAMNSNPLLEQNPGYD